MTSFWNNQNDTQRSRYISLLQKIGALSKIFSDSNIPYLYYRAHENLFCEIFCAKNLSRGDVSFDAVKGKMGIGLKTFLNNNGNTFQKVAEFNSESQLFRQITNMEEIIFRVAEMRNKRINTTANMTGTSESIYHIITRSEGKFNIVETPMDLIDIDSIKFSKNQSKNTIKFSDQFNDYSFSLSKSTLLKRFDTTEKSIITKFDVPILSNPIQLLDELHFEFPKIQSTEEHPFIILPLYSVKQKDVLPGSGLNQWNASGRQRDLDEVYIPIPSWIHEKFPDFFVYSRQRKTKQESGKKHPDFSVELPNASILKCKIAQSGGKALMSNPNKDLGKWLLRDVLKIPKGQVLTMKTLQEIGIDSVKLTKKNDSYYYLDFMETGSYDEFIEKFQ